MKTFNYVVRDSEGARKEGFKQAISPGDVIGWLHEQQLVPISIKETTNNTKKKQRKSGNKRIKSAELSAFCWQLTTMVEGGIPITSAVETIAEDIDNLYLQKILQRVLERINRGEGFSDSLSEFPKVFNKLSLAIILAGETSGNLADALQTLAEYFTNRDKLTKKVKSALAYPIFMVSFIILIVIAIMTFIIPRFQMIFTQLKGEMPAFTRGFMAVYDIIRFNAHYIIGIVVVLVVSVTWTYTKSRKGHYMFSRLFLSLPLFGNLFREAFLVTFCKTTATLLSAGVSVLEVFDILGGMSNNDIIKDAITTAKQNVVQGSNVSLGLKISGFFPNMVVKMIDVGEQSGSLTKVLNRTAEYYERKLDATLSTIMSLIEPIMIVVVGGIVMVTVLALYLPVFQMSDV